MAEPHSLSSLLLLFLLTLHVHLLQGGKSSSSLQTTTTAISTSKTSNTTLTATSHVSNDTVTMTQVQHNSSMISSSPVSEAVTNTTYRTGSTQSTSNSSIQQTNTKETSNTTFIPGGAHVPYKGISDNPGLVAVICIFVSLLCIALVVTAVKFCQKNEPEFKKLDEVPMNGMSEEAPFARYPPK
ncbi:putative LOC729966 homolog isoform X3 [Mixophyes fleayi]|uniref:putative LOC729966 homolog isoform X3 n=1 Tax=Mixophyes fleayi TaxID=3061075 RepID=UPI003F4D8454